MEKIKNDYREDGINGFGSFTREQAQRFQGTLVDDYDDKGDKVYGRLGTITPSGYTLVVGGKKLVRKFKNAAFQNGANKAGTEIQNKLEGAGLKVENAASVDTWEVVSVGRQNQQKRKVFKQKPQDAPGSAERSARAYEAQLDKKDKASEYGLYRSISTKNITK